MSVATEHTPGKRICDADGYHITLAAKALVDRMNRELAPASAIATGAEQSA